MSYLETVDVNLNFKTDDYGFMTNFSKWNEEIAEIIAGQTGILFLSDEHWEIIYSLREYYSHFGKTPTIKAFCIKTNLSLKKVYSLFPKGPVKGAYKIAGLPRPESCY